MSPVPDPSAPLLPHRGTMLWVDHAILSADHNVARARFEVARDFPFLRDGFLPPPALIELLAQAAGCGSAMKVAHAGRRVKQGFLAAIREFSMHAAVPAGVTLELVATHERTLGPLSMAYLEAYLDGRLVAEARMTFHLTME